MKLPSKTRFISEKLKKDFYSLKNGDDSERKLYFAIGEAMDNLEENAFAGTQIKKKLMLNEYKNLGMQNLWKYNLPKGWRLLYAIKKEEIIIVSIILDWMDHKKYEGKFKF